MALSDRCKLLSEFSPGDMVVVQAITGEGPVSKRLMELGLVEGTTVRLIKRAPFGEPIEVKFRGSHLALRLDEAANVVVEKIES